MNRRIWIASVGATAFITRLRTDDTAKSVDFSNDAVWSELVTPAFATAARTVPFHPELADSDET